jgi:hypothetical protein
MSCENYIDCDNAYLSLEELLRKSLVNVDGDLAIRVTGEAGGGGSTPGLEAVLTEDNDGGGLEITNIADGTQPTSAATVGQLSILQEETIKFAEVAISAATFGNALSSPVQLMAAPGVGKVIFPIAIAVHLNYNTTPYGSATQIQVYLNGAASSLFISDSQLPSQPESTLDMMQHIINVAPNLKENAALMMTTDSDDEVGDSPFTFHIAYKELTIA